MIRLTAMIRSVDLIALAVTLGLAGLGGAAAAALHLPLGYLMGSLLVTGVIAALGLRPFGKPVTLPTRLRFSFVPIIGLSIGGAFTPQVAQQALGWGPSLAALFLFVPLAHLIGYAIYRRGGLARTEAYFGAVPGGVLESVQLGEEAGADVRLLTVLQFLRLILTIVTVPLIFSALTGHAVGSAGGAQMGAGTVLGLIDALILAVAGAAGAWIGWRLHIPAWIITGPLFASALLHVTGVVHGSPPGWLISATQVVLGAGLGARFAGIEKRLLRRAASLAALNGVAALLLAFAFAGAVHALADEPLAAAFLAFAPGGLTEMTLIALSLHMSAIYVTAHHVLRIVLAVSTAKLGARFLNR